MMRIITYVLMTSSFLFSFLGASDLYIQPAYLVFVVACNSYLKLNISKIELTISTPIKSFREAVFKPVTLTYPLLLLPSPQYSHLFASSVRFPYIYSKYIHILISPLPEFRTPSFLAGNSFLTAFPFIILSPLIQLSHFSYYDLFSFKTNHIVPPLKSSSVFSFIWHKNQTPHSVACPRTILKVGPWTSNISRKIVRNADSQASHQLCWTRNSEGGVLPSV